LKRIRLRTGDEMEPQDRARTDIDAAMAVWRNSAFRLLMLTLLIFLLSGLVPATGVWRIAIGGFAALMLAGLLVAWIGLDRVLGRVSTGFRSNQSTPSLFETARYPTTQSVTGPRQP
jgi:hypothetical protein